MLGGVATTKQRQEQELDTRREVARWRADLESWAAQMERAADNCRWLLENTAPGEARDRAAARLELSVQLAGRFRVEAAAWAVLLAERPDVVLKGRR